MQECETLQASLQYTRTVKLAQRFKISVFAIKEFKPSELRCRYEDFVLGGGCHSSRRVSIFSISLSSGIFFIPEVCFVYLRSVIRFLD